MNENNRQVIVSLLDNVKRLLRGEGVFKTNSELYLRMVAFEDEFYNLKNPPKQTKEDLQNDTQQPQAAIQPKCSECNPRTLCFTHPGTSQCLDHWTPITDKRDLPTEQQPCG